MAMKLPKLKYSLIFAVSTLFSTNAFALGEIVSSIERISSLTTRDSLIN